MRFLILLAALAALPAVVSPAVSQTSAVQRFEGFLRDTNSLRADFQQTVYGQEGKVVQQSSGSFVLLRPGRFRWTYARPVDQLIVGDGERVWIYDRDLQQVTVRKLSKALGSTPAALLAGSSDVSAAFVLSDGGEHDGLQWVNAKPKDPEAGFEIIRLGFNAQGIAAMELKDHFGHTTKLAFRDVQRNPQVDAAQFRFTPPPGADVLGTP